MSATIGRIGIDLGGTKIEGQVLGAGGRELARQRVASPQGDYARTVRALADMVAHLEQSSGSPAGIMPVGIGMPGSLAPRSGLVQNANSTWLNGRPLLSDLEAALGKRVRLANDANCFALSEATDGAGAGAGIVFGVILGTGCGGGIVIGGRLVEGPRGISGEWGHTPLPWMSADEAPGPLCWCGRRGCMETLVSGPGLAHDFARATGEAADPQRIAVLAAAGHAGAGAALDRHADRLARGLAAVIDILDPDVIVLGGGLSHLDHLYLELPRLIAPHVFADQAEVVIRPPRWGDASGVRGAAWLWPPAGA